MNRQTVIPLGGKPDQTLEQFVIGRNAELHALLTALASAPTSAAETRLVYIWGESGSGKSHLLSGLSEKARESGTAFRWLSPGRLPDAGQLLDQNLLLIVDNLGSVVASNDSAVELLSLYERAMAEQMTLVIGSSLPPDRLADTLPDLASRFSSGVSYQVYPLEDGDKRMALKQRAAARGFGLDDQVIEFIMRHVARDTGSLFRLLDRLDSASLSHQRKVTIPFVRSLISGS